jgi:hypothetical protein
MDTQNKLYNKYSNWLGRYSICIRPVLEASYERYFVQFSANPDLVDLEEYCVYERRRVEYYRNLLKQTKNEKETEYKTYKQYIKDLENNSTHLV